MSTTNSGSSSSSSLNWIQRKICHHGVEADLLTSGTVAKPFRRYYRCRLDGTCNASLPKIMRSAFNDELRSIASREWSIASMERLTVEQLSVKDEQIQELQKLKVVVDDLIDELFARKVE
ncbi:hypothetical protein OROHE_019775 [Orobanche hederae]